MFRKYSRTFFNIIGDIPGKFGGKMIVFISNERVNKIPIMYCNC